MSTRKPTPSPSLPLGGDLQMARQMAKILRQARCSVCELEIPYPADDVMPTHTTAITCDTVPLVCPGGGKPPRERTE